MSRSKTAVQKRDGQNGKKERTSNFFAPSGARSFSPTKEVGIIFTRLKYIQIRWGVENLGVNAPEVKVPYLWKPLSEPPNTNG